MKSLKVLLVLMAVALVTFGLSGMSYAFHNGGVAYCEGCHTMHNSADNPANGGTTHTYLMKGTDPSSTCLNCHSGSGGYHIASTNGSNKGTGGDFYWVKTDFTRVVRGSTVTSKGEQHGHNIVAFDYGYSADTNPSNQVAPGGSYAASKLGCNSCHDPHGQGASTTTADATRGNSAPISASGSYGDPDPTDGSILGNYRLLGGAGYDGGELGGVTFTAAAPIARSSHASGESYGLRTDYGSGMSEWCLNCHSGISAAGHHVVGNTAKLNGAEGTNYNRYVKTGTLNGTVATAFDKLVPIERGITDRTALEDVSSAEQTLGADANSNVMCLTCHRAHASAHENMGRWDFKVEFLEESAALISNSLPATAIANAYSGVDVVAKYGEWQRQLCNKCHVQD